MEQKIPLEIRLYLNEIAERLWSGHAAVMVGAGFSKNAKKSDSTKKDFPDWSQLGNVFHEKIYGTKPDEKQHYLNVLKLADEVQAAFGRPVLDQILRLQIPDKEYEPSQLHIKLMELPWTDVFTTNYDTLLERSCVNVVSQRFDIVICKEDLVYSEKPRIIKLHGSFPSERPFVITEEDYRKYPKDFAPFVNTVQQSLLENTLCLIGFSGDDPNFLQWIGWIQDNLGKVNSPKLYLIGIFTLSHAQKKLLEQRNIVLLDISVCDGVNGNHEKALNVFIDFLLSVKKAENNLGWPEEQHMFHPSKNEDIIDQITLASREWKSTRENYPNWVVLPEDRRDELWLYTKDSIYLLHNLSKISAPDDLNFLFEFNWRIERCLCPIFNELSTIYEEVLERYIPFPDEVSINNSIIHKDDKYKILWNEVEQKWLELNISLMRFYREEGFIEKWNLVNEKLKMFYKFLSPELIARLHYERCLCALFLFNITEIKAKIKEWPVNISLPLWEAKRGGLLAEIGEIDHAEKFLEQSLSSIRKQLNLSPIANNYLLVSQESYVMQLLQYVNNSIALRDGDFESRNENRQRFSERWNNLKQYKCDPWNELNQFQIKLEREPVCNLNNIQKKEFDIGRVTTSYNFYKTDEEALTAYCFLRYCEDSGNPFRIQNTTYGKKAAEGALKRISNYSPFWAFATLIRIGDSSGVKTLFNRESICKMVIGHVDVLINDYLSVIENALPDITLGNRFKRENFADVLVSVIPEILSRLCVKCSDDTRFKLLDFLNKLYLSEQKYRFQGIANLMERLISSLSDKNQYELLPKLLKFPIVTILNEVIEREFPDPFNFISINTEFKSHFVEIEIDNSVVKQLIKSVKANNKERKIAAIRLEKLYKLDLLNENQRKAFSTALWSQVDQDFDLPKDTDFYKFAFLNLPYPDDISPGTLFKKFILKERFPIQKLKKDNGISITGGDIQLCYEIVTGTKNKYLNKNGVEWSLDEALTILNQLIEWWDSDKHYLKQDDTTSIFSTIPDEFGARFRHLVLIISNVIAPVLHKNSNKETKESIIRLLNELSEYEIPCVQAKAACIPLIDNKAYIYLEIVDAISSKEHSRIIDALYAVLELLDYTKSPSDLECELDDILNILSQQIKWRRQDSLISTLNIISNIVSEFPQYLNEKFLSDVMIGLKYLCNESNPSNLEVQIDVSDRLLYRRSAAHLAFRLYRYYSEKQETVPQAIIDWKNICSDKNEFAEICNQWIYK